MPPLPHKAERRVSPSGRSLRAALLLALLPATAIHAASKPKPSDPILTLPLDSVGYTPPPPHSLASAFYTLHFVDPTHLLFTFNSRELLTRLPDATPEDDDRNITALLLELPSGKVLARTLWRTRDRAQYLWPLTHGRFLLRIRNKLTVIQPLENLRAESPFHETPFHEQPFLDMKRRIGFITISPGGDLLTIETAPPLRTDPAILAAALAAQTQALARAAAAAAAQAPTQTQPQLRNRNSLPATTATAAPIPVAAPLPPKPTPPNDIEPERPGRLPVDLHFFRLFLDSKPGEPDRLMARTAGVLASRALINLPATAEGFLEVVQESKSVYNFDFQTHAGKRSELAAYDTSCVPRPYFVSRTEFVAFGCHGSADKVELSGFNLRGEEPWVSVLPGRHIAPAIVAAPESSRFALSRILVNPSVYDLDNIQSDELLGQEILVTQNHDGRTLLKLQVTPIQRGGQNFDLSPDGLFLTVVRTGNIELYRLPPLTPADQKELGLAQAALPEKNDQPIKLLSTKHPTSAPAAEALTVAADPVDTPAPLPQTPGPTVGDLHPTAESPRKPPTLYDPDHPKPPPNL